MLQKIWIAMGLLAVGGLVAVPSLAQEQEPAQARSGSDGLSPDSDKPLEITADGTLEWHREKKIFVARKNSVARQGETSIASQTLTADYRDGAGKDMEIWRVTAAQDVVIDSRENKAYGEQAVYDLDRGVAVMTGDNLRMVSPDQTVTAKESFEYWVADGRLVAIGEATVVRLEDTLSADKITAVMKEDGQGKRVLDTLEAEGNVVITTPTETLNGDRGVYRAADNKAEIDGHVVIRRGPNELRGSKADVDLTTNVSRMFGSSSEGGRVRGVFYPGTAKKPDKQAKP